MAQIRHTSNVCVGNARHAYLVAGTVRAAVLQTSDGP
jgi:hypothetical protein